MAKNLIRTAIAEMIKQASSADVAAFQERLAQAVQNGFTQGDIDALKSLEDQIYATMEKVTQNKYIQQQLKDTESSRASNVGRSIEGATEQTVGEMTGTLRGMLQLAIECNGLISQGNEHLCSLMSNAVNIERNTARNAELALEIAQSVRGVPKDMEAMRQDLRKIKENTEKSTASYGI